MLLRILVAFESFASRNTILSHGPDKETGLVSSEIKVMTSIISLKTIRKKEYLKRCIKITVWPETSGRHLCFITTTRMNKRSNLP